ncbi:hypothetical protein B0T17DRAFT_294513 [Bombardia bombarda]|uniref:Uncharacterized protein n=1 Tax=Bombardia bombarda TaxID=252184 RepID=A0AA40C243_9PEZI|nr:hypothetical protein B0T17DRAFT_294513 [Bombardia bombarda]
MPNKLRWKVHSCQLEASQSGAFQFPTSTISKPPNDVRICSTILKHESLHVNLPLLSSPPGPLCDPLSMRLSYGSTNVQMSNPTRCPKSDRCPKPALAWTAGADSWARGMAKWRPSGSKPRAQGPVPASHKESTLRAPRPGFQDPTLQFIWPHRLQLLHIAHRCPRGCHCYSSKARCSQRCPCYRRMRSRLGTSALRFSRTDHCREACRVHLGDCLVHLPPLL